MSNRFKPRYKICYQTKNKIWFNKNSRLKNFYSLRNKFLMFRGRKYQNRLKLKSMKWIIARRFMIPRLRNRNYPKFRYGNNFRNKQQLKKFYGKIKEYQLRHIFKQTWLKHKIAKKESFIGALEQRLDMVLYRTRLLPTIFACHQLISHQGVYINNNKINIPNYRVQIGDIISLKNDQWHSVFNRLENKLHKRTIGANVINKRQLKISKKIDNFKKVKKNSSKNNLKLVRQVHKMRTKFIFLNNQLKLLESNNICKYDELLKLKVFLFLQIEPKLIRIEKLLFLLKNWNKIDKIQSELEIITILLSIQKDYNKIIYTIESKKIISLQNNKLLDKENDQILNVNLKNKKILLLKNSIEYNKRQRFLKKLGKSLFFNKSFLMNKRRNHFNFKRLMTKQRLKFKKKRNPWWEEQPHWFTPNYLEIDYKTLRISYIYNPLNKEVFYPFFCSFDEVVNFYKTRGL